MKKDIIEDLNFNVAGVTFNNDDGKNRQQILKKILNGYKNEGYFESFNGYSNKDIKEFGLPVYEYDGFFLESLKFTETTYKNQLAYEVYLLDVNNKYHLVGFVPQNTVEELKFYLDNYNVIGIAASFIGGRYKDIDYDDVNLDKEIVVIKDDLDIGVNIHIKLELPKTIYICNKCKKEITEDEEKYNNGICNTCKNNQKHCILCDSVVYNYSDYYRYSGLCLNCFQKKQKLNSLRENIATLLIFVFGIIMICLLLSISKKI